MDKEKKGGRINKGKKRPISKRENVPAQGMAQPPRIIGSENAKHLPPEILDQLNNMTAQGGNMVPPNQSPQAPLTDGKRKKSIVTSTVTELPLNADVGNPSPPNTVESNVVEETPEEFSQDELPPQTQPYANPQVHTHPQQPQPQQPQPAQPQQAPVQQNFIPPVNQQALRTFFVVLPSVGLLYDGVYPEGKIEVRPMTTKEEALLYSPGDTLGHINKILDSCIVTRNMDPMDLTITDRFAVLLYLRTFSYGAQYEIPFQCQHCTFQKKTVIDIASDLEVEYMEEGSEEPFETELPMSGHYIHFRLLRGRDESEINKYAKKMKMKSMDEGDPSHIYRLAKSIVAIDGVEVDSIDQAKWFIMNLVAGDANYLRLAIDEVEGKIDTNVYMECPSCGNMNEFPMPFTAEFFRPSRR